MTDKRIKEISEKVYSNENKIRISLTYGWSGIDIDKTSFIELIKIFRDSCDVIRDLNKFWKECEE